VKEIDIRSVEFEARRWPYILAWPLSQTLVAYVIAKKAAYGLLGRAPRINTAFWDGFADSCNTLKESQSSWRAMHEIYDYRFGKRRGFKGWLSDFWLKMLNCQALRNRKRMAVDQLEKTILEFAQVGDEVRVLSLASGTGQDVLEALERLPNITVRAKLVDRNEEAITFGQGLFLRSGLKRHVDFVVADGLTNRALLDSCRPHIVLMCGLLEYLSDEQVIDLAKSIRHSLAPGGVLITSNIDRNIESRFVTHVVNWPMIYRTSRQLSALLDQAGFDCLDLFTEPLRLHTLAVATSTAADEALIRRTDEQQIPAQ